MIKIDDIYTIIDKILTELKLTDKLIVTAAFSRLTTEDRNKPPSSVGGS